MVGPRARLKALAGIAVVAAAVSVAASASGEVNQRDGIRVYLSGKMTPTTLPRQGAAPIAVSLSSRIASVKPGDLPQLSEIEIAINRHGQLNRQGLPVCRLGHIDPSTTTEARRACPDSLVGEGTFSADVKIPEQSPFPSQGTVLAFNGRLRGKPAIFAHIFGREPVPTSYVLPFMIRRTGGGFGTILEASLPRVTGDWGYVTGISLTLGRRFSSHGRQTSYLAAGCPAPSGFRAAPFPLAKAKFDFEGGTTLTSTIVRTCRVQK